MAISISLAAGLHARVLVVPVAVITGGVTSAVQVTVLEVVAELPQASTAVKIGRAVSRQILLVAVASVSFTVGVPHASVAVAVPRAASISLAAGLHARLLVVPVAVITGGVTSAVQVTVLEVVAELPQASTAVKVLT